MNYDINDLKKLKEFLTLNNINFDDVCLVGSSTLSLLGIRNHDDIDLILSRIKIKLGGSDAGHNGIKSVDMHIGKEYNRIRVGVGKPTKYLEAKDYVLQKFTSDEILKLKNKIDILVENIHYLFKNDVNNFLNILASE